MIKENPQLEKMLGQSAKTIKESSGYLPQDDPAFKELDLDDDLLIKPRVADLVRDQMVEIQNGNYDLKTKGRIMALVFRQFRHLMGAGKGG